MENLSIKELLIKLFTDPVKLAVEKYKDHPSIISIKNKTARIDNPKYSFSFVSLNETLDRINKLNTKKASQATDILVKITKGNKDLVSFYVFHNFNNVLSSCSWGHLHCTRPCAFILNPLSPSTSVQILFFKEDMTEIYFVNYYHQS